MTESHSIILGPDEGRELPVGDSSIRFLASGDDTGNASSAEEIRVPPGFEGPPPHYHESTSHSWYVLEGTLRLTLDHGVHDVASGGFLYVPAGISHKFANPSSAPGRILQFTTPGGFHRYLEALADAFPSGTRVDPERMIEIMARFDTYPTE